MSEKPCAGLINENYEYALSGDLGTYCKCMVTGRSCLAKEIGDPDERSSQFFSRAKCSISKDKLKNCPLYGASADVFKQVLLDRSKQELEEKLKELR